jgi:hypothetical protein
MRTTLCGVTLALTLALGAWPIEARAQSDADRATARALFAQAQQALGTKDFAAAADLFGRSDALVHAPTASLGFARAQIGLGRLVGAYETLNRIVREGLPPSPSPAFAKALEDARAEMAALKSRLPTVVITVSGPAEPAVTVDGAPVPKAALGVPRFVDPGAHKVAASGRGFLAGETQFSVDESGTARADLALRRDPKFPALGGDGPPPAAPTDAEAHPAAASAPDASRPASGRRVAGFVVGGVGAAGLVVAGITGGLYLSNKSTAEAHCTTNKQCDQEGLDAVSSSKTLGVVNTVALFAGAAAVGAGVYLVLSSRPATAPAPSASPGAVTRLAWSAAPGRASFVLERSF